MLVVGHDHGNMAVGSIVLSVVPIGKLIGTRKSEFAGSPPLTQVPGASMPTHEQAYEHAYSRPYEYDVPIIKIIK